MQMGSSQGSAQFVDIKLFCTITIITVTTTTSITIITIAIIIIIIMPTTIIMGSSKNFMIHFAFQSFFVLNDPVGPGFEAFSTRERRVVLQWQGAHHKRPLQGFNQLSTGG